MIPLYIILSTLAAFFVLPGFALYSWITGKKRRGLAHHFGGMSWVKKETGHKTLWVHALSLGEVNATAPVLKRIRQENADLNIVVTVTTENAGTLTADIRTWGNALNLEAGQPVSLCWRPDAGVLVEESAGLA